MDSRKIFMHHRRDTTAAPLRLWLAAACLALTLTGCARRHATNPPPAAPAAARGEPVHVEEFRRDTIGPVRGWSAVVNLDDPRVRVVLTGPPERRADDPPGTEAHLTTVPEFADATGATLAVNASFFGRLDGKSGWSKGVAVDVIGPWTSEGRVLSPGRTAGQGEPTLIIRTAHDGRGSRATVACALAPDYADARNVLGGTSKADGSSGCLIVRQGGAVAELARVDPAARHPRTAAGVSADGTRLILLVIDGRQPAWSIGATLPELARWMLDLGAADALNFDGGGSSSFVYRPASGAEVVNRPSDRHWRPVATAIGVRLEP